MKKFATLLLSVFFLPVSITAMENNDKEEYFKVVQDTCVYFNNNHVAFTSLVSFNGEMYLAFREAGSHHSSADDRGVIRVLKKDYKQGWITHHVFSLDGWDLRDPCLVIWGDKLLLYTSYHYAVYTEQGWSELRNVYHNAPHQVYLWKIRTYGNELYSIGHSWGHWPLLLKSNDGINWEVIDEYQIGGNATEADLLFVDNKLFICFRVETPDGSHSMWGESSYPFKKTSWTQMAISIASPELIMYSKRSFLLSGRESFFNSDTRTIERRVSLFRIDKKGNIINSSIINCNSEDQGYCGFTKVGKRTFSMSYYVGGVNVTEIRLLTFRL